MSDETRCKGCGKPMVWGITKDGKKIPLDPRAPTYRFVLKADSEGNLHPIHRDGILVVDKTEKGEAMVSHFSTCPKANEF